MPTTWNLISSVAQILLQLICSNYHRLTFLQYEQHSRPLSWARVPPRVVCAALHRNVPSFQQRHAPIVQLHLNLALQNDAVVERLRPVHERRALGTEVYNPTDSTAGLNESKCTGCHGLRVRRDVGVIIEIHREFGCCVSHIESDISAWEPGPFTVLRGMQLCQTSIVVPSYMDPAVWEPRWKASVIGLRHS